jgi:DNA-binding MarR family transcriptional regulator
MLSGAQRNGCGNSLELAPGYLSRILGSFEKCGLIEKTPSEDDGRQIL